MILVVNSEQDICETLITYLKKEGYQTEIARLGREAIKKFKEKKPSLVFLDIKLSDIDGVEVVKKFKEIDPAIPVIMLTALKDEGKVVSAFRVGACDCIFDPLDFKYIKTVMLASIGNKK